MNWTIDFTTEFSRGAKVLKKRYKSFMDDLEDFKDSIMKNPRTWRTTAPVRLPTATQWR